MEPLWHLGAEQTSDIISSSNIFNYHSTSAKNLCFRDAVLLAASGATYRLLLCFGILPILYVANDILYPFAKTVYGEFLNIRIELSRLIISARGDLVQFHAIELFFSALPSYAIPGISPTVTFFVYAMLYGTINFAFVAYQVLLNYLFFNRISYGLGYYI